MAGSLIAGFFLARYFPNARGSGIPQTKTALFLRDRYIRFRTVLGKFSMCAITLASGIALGREGPSVEGLGEAEFAPANMLPRGMPIAAAWRSIRPIPQLRKAPISAGGFEAGAGRAGGRSHDDTGRTG